MRKLDRLRLLEAPDHAILARPWEFDVLQIDCSWALGDRGSRLEVSLSKPLGTQAVTLRFIGVDDLRLDGFQPLDGFRILDATAFRPEIPAPVCVIPYQWSRGDTEPYFWAQSVEIVNSGSRV
jgi:hypothetical protein